MSEGLAPPKILLVEDDSVFRMLVKRLVGEDYSITEASSLDAGRQELAQQRFDCLLLDFRLPDGNGLQMLPDAILLDLPVVMMTAMGHEQLAVDAIKQGCQDYLIKDDLTRASLTRSLANAMRHVQADRQAMRSRIALQKIVAAAAGKCREATTSLRNICCDQTDGAPKREPMLDQLDHLMDGLVAYSRLTSVSWTPESISLGELAKEVADELQMLLPDLPIDLSSNSSLTLKSDRDAVKAICREVLVIAAVDNVNGISMFTTTDVNAATIDVKFAANGDAVRSIQSQLDARMQPSDQSSGNMGLEVVRLLVEQLGGRISMEEASENAQIQIRLPNSSTLSGTIAS
ncbi:response regulator [bacterium]|nr:response regulator [bacterium]